MDTHIPLRKRTLSLATIGLKCGAVSRYHGQMKILAALFFLTAIGPPALAGDFQVDKKGVDKSCRKDADKIGCKGMTLGNGLGRCIYEYKQKNPKYTPSESCRNAMMKLRQGKFAGNMTNHFAKYRQEPLPKPMVKKGVPAAPRNSKAPAPKK